MTVAAAPDLILVTEEAHQLVTGAAQNGLMDADCWIAVAGDDYSQGKTGMDVDRCYATNQETRANVFDYIEV